MSIVVPFNFQPSSTTVRTGSYTIPAGFYAYVSVHCEPGGTFSIDGNEALSAINSDGFDVISVDQSVNNSSTYTVPTGYYFQGTAYTSGSTVLLGVDGTTVFDSHSGAGSMNEGRFPISFTAGSGSVISTNSSDSMNIVGACIRNGSPRNDVFANFWVPSGTDLTESGDTKYTVTLYPELN